MNTENTQTVTLSEARVNIAIGAASEIEQLSRLMIRRPGEVDDAYDLALASRGLAMRIIDLSEIIMSAVGDEIHPVDDLDKRLNG